MLIFFAEILHTGRAAIYMKHIKRDFSLKAWVRVCWVDLGGNILPTDTPLIQGVGSKGQTIYFSESSHVAYQIKADDSGSNMVANILPTDTPSTQGVGSKGQPISFSERSHVAYQIKGN